MPSILDHQRDRFAANASDRRAFEALEEAAFVAGDWDELVGVLQHRLEDPALVDEFRERARVLYRLGQAEERRGRAEAALVHWHAAVVADPACRSALLELRRDAVDNGRWDVALQIADAELALELASDERATLSAETGTLWLEHFDAAEQALAHFEQALDALPRLDAALEGAARACEQLERDDAAGAYWGRAAETRRGADRARALVAQAALLARQPDGHDRSAELFRSALSNDPENTDALDALAANAERDAHWSLACDLLERRFAAETDPACCAQIALRAGRHHYSQLGAPEAARTWLDLAVEADPALLEAWRLLAEVERETGEDGGLRRALGELVERDDQPASLATLVELASLDSGANDEAAAAEHLRAALSLAPDDALVIEALSDSLAQLGAWEELANCLERRAAIAANDPATCAAAYEELGSVQEGQLGDVDAACTSYERALQADPAHANAIAALERIYRKREEWEQLRTLLEHAERSSTRDTRPERLCALGDLLIDSFNDASGAAAAYDTALELKHTCAAAHRGRQRLAEGDDDPEALLTAYEHEAEVTTDRSRLRFLVGELTTLCRERERPDAALRWTEHWIETAPDDVEALEHAVALHRELGHDAELVAALERVDPLLQSAEQAELRCSLGQLHRGHERIEPAIAAFHAALEADPRHGASLEALVELLEGTGPAKDLICAHRSLAELSTGKQRVRSLDALARLLEEQLGDMPQAIDVLERLAQEPGAPADVENRLEVLLDRTARHEELAERLALRAAGCTADERRDLTLRRGAILLEQLSEFDAAVTTYREVLAEDPRCETARHGLERALRASADPRGLAEFLGEQATQHEDAATRDRCAFERAVILEEVLASNDEAAEIFHALSRKAAEPDARRRAAERLEALLERVHDYEALRAHLEEWLRRTDDEPTRATLHDRLGRLCRHRLEDPEATAEHLEAAAAIDPLCGERWNTLARLYEEQDLPRDLVRALEGQLAAEPDMEPGREHTLRARVAALCATRLGESDRARDQYERVLELDPSDSAAGEFLIDYWEANARPDQVARLLELRLGGLDAQPRDTAGYWAAQRTSLRLRIAGLRANELDDPDGAIAVLEPALGEIGPQAAVAEPLADLYQRAGYAEDLIELCGKAADACDPGLERAAWLTRLGHTLRSRRRDAKAVAAYERALDERPGDTAIEAALRELYRILDAPEPLARLLEAELARLGGPAEIPVRLELANLWTESLDRPADALLELRRIVHLDPSHAEALDRGLDLAAQLDRPSVVRELLDDALRREHTASARADLLARRAQLLASLPDSSDAALADYREALRLHPDRLETRAELRRLLESTGDWRAALECLCEEAYRVSPSERVKHLERGAKLAWEHLSPDAALAWLERLRRERPQQSEVLARIAEAHRLAGRPHPQLRALEAELDATDEPARRRALLCECARVLEHDLGWQARASAAYEQARETAPNDTEVLRELDRLYAETGRDRERAHILEALAPSAAPADRAQLLRDAAALHRGQLRDPREAARLLLRAVAETRATGSIHGELLRELADALWAAGPPDAWASCAETELAALDPDAEVFAERRLRLRRDLAAYYQRTGCLDAAIRHLNALVDGAPPEFDPAGVHEASLLYALRCQGNSVELERRTTRRLERTGGDAEAWLALARLRDERLSATARAAEAYRRAVALAADPSEALRGLRSAAERLARWDEVAATLELELEHNAALPPAGRSALLRRLGDVCWKQLGSTTRASRAYAGAIEAWPEDFAAQRSFEHLLEAMEDWRGALDLYESEVDVLGDREPDRRQAAWLRAGELAMHRTDEPHRALRAYVAAAAIGELAPERRLERAELHQRCGEGDAFAEVFASWCDDPQANGGSADHLRLAETLEALGRLDEALARSERALEAGTAGAHAWATAARLREASGAHAEASAAWQQAAEKSTGAKAAEHWRRAAAPHLSGDPMLAAALLRKAAEADPAAGAVHADLAEAALQIESWDEAETAARSALDTQPAHGSLDADARIAVALIGARAARQHERPAAAAEFYHAALAVDPACDDALAGAGESLAAIEEWASAREPLAARLAHSKADPDAARHHALLARCHAELHDVDAALAECEAALEIDATHTAAHTLCVSLHEAADRLEPGIAALERWAQQTDGDAAGEHLLRAGEWELRVENRNEAAEDHLRRATETAPGLSRAWRLLASLLWEAGRAAEAAEAAAAGLATHAEREDRAALHLVLGRALEADGKAACKAYAAACEADPRCLEAALAEARLLRAAGEWSASAETLERFVDRHPGDDPAGLAEALQQRARLLAGPLEDLDGAIDAYRRALAFQPESRELRVTLANLLSQRPEAWPEALEQHAATLEELPSDPDTLRAVLRIAEYTGNAEAIGNGLALLRALGIATAEEAAAAPDRMALVLAPRLGLDSTLGEALRAAVQCAAEDIGRALGAPGHMATPDAGADPTAQFRADALTAQAELTAHGLLPLPTNEMADVVRCVALLALDPASVHTSGATLNAISETFGRRARRRVRRVLGGVTRGEIEGLDFTLWRQELRTLAAARAVDIGAGDLRTALLAGICNAEDHSPGDFEPTRDIAVLVAACDEARGVMQRAVRAWLTQITA
ncbi:MAG: hypothetical protein JRG84_09275 [Deltaproteobacteria bacterium]|nr:hypothetical protein [Deltaproteobacteria bacterium]